jgi:hypothetical protein
MLDIIWLMAMVDKWRPDGVLWGCWTIVIPSVSIKDRTVAVPQVMLNACLMFSWPDKSFRPRSPTLSRPVSRSVRTVLEMDGGLRGREE